MSCSETNADIMAVFEYVRCALTEEETKLVVLSASSCVVDLCCASRFLFFFKFQVEEIQRKG